MSSKGKSRSTQPLSQPKDCVGEVSESSTVVLIDDELEEYIPLPLTLSFQPLNSSPSSQSEVNSGGVDPSLPLNESPSDSISSSEDLLTTGANGITDDVLRTETAYLNETEIFIHDVPCPHTDPWILETDLLLKQIFPKFRRNPHHSSGLPNILASSSVFPVHSELYFTWKNLFTVGAVFFIGLLVCAILREFYDDDDPWNP